MAMILPVFITIALGCVDFGRFAYSYIAVSNAARAGAAYAMMRPPSSYASPPAAWQTAIRNAVSNEMFEENYHATGNSTGLTVAAVTPVLNGDGTTYRFTVTASYPFTTVVTWSISMFGTPLGIPQSLTLSKSATMPFIRN
jgi:Flp pilus assembly protein TadG